MTLDLQGYSIRLIGETGGNRKSDIFLLVNGERTGSAYVTSYVLYFRPYTDLKMFSFCKIN